MSKTDASKKSGKKKKLRKLAAQKLAHAAANNALNDISRMHRRWARPITGAR